MTKLIIAALFIMLMIVICSFKFIVKAANRLTMPPRTKPEWTNEPERHYPPLDRVALVKHGIIKAK